MKTKLDFLTTFVIISLILTVGLLFWYGSKQIKNANNIQSTIIAWENLNNQINSLLENNNNLNLIIQNLETKKNTYKIKFLLNNQVINSQKIEILPEHKKIIQPNKQILTKMSHISKQSNQQQNILYQIKIIWNQDKNSEILGKWIK